MENGGKRLKHSSGSFGLVKNVANAINARRNNMKKAFKFEQKKVKKKTRQGCGHYSKGMKKYKGQGGPRKRFQTPKK